MAKNVGNWFENAKNVLVKITNINSTGSTWNGLVGGSAATTSYGADGAIALTDTLALLKSASASTVMTLALTTQVQRMTIVAFNYSNTMTVTADFGGAITTATFSEAGEAIDLYCDTNAWYVVGNNGVVLS